MRFSEKQNGINALFTTLNQQAKLHKCVISYFTKKKKIFVICYKHRHIHTYNTESDKFLFF